MKQGTSLRVWSGEPGHSLGRSIRSVGHIGNELHWWRREPHVAGRQLLAERDGKDSAKAIAVVSRPRGQSHEPSQRADRTMFRGWGLKAEYLPTALRDSGLGPSISRNPSMSSSFAGLITQSGAGCMTDAGLVNPTSQYMQILVNAINAHSTCLRSHFLAMEFVERKGPFMFEPRRITNKPGELVTPPSILGVLTGPINKESSEAFEMPIEALVIAQGKG